MGFSIWRLCREYIYTYQHTLYYCIECYTLYFSMCRISEEYCVLFIYTFSCRGQNLITDYTVAWSTSHASLSRVGEVFIRKVSSMILGLIRKFGALSVMLGIAWLLSRMQIWGAEYCTGMYIYSVNLRCKFYSSAPLLGPCRTILTVS